MLRRRTVAWAERRLRACIPQHRTLIVPARASGFTSGRGAAEAALHATAALLHTYAPWHHPRDIDSMVTSADDAGVGFAVQRATRHLLDTLPGCGLRADDVGSPTATRRFAAALHDALSSSAHQHAGSTEGPWDLVRRARRLEASTRQLLSCGSTPTGRGAASSATIDTATLHALHRRLDRPLSDVCRYNIVAHELMVNERKRLETERVCDCAHALRLATGAVCVVDAGAGKGHVGEVLATTYNTPSLSVELQRGSMDYGRALYDTAHAARLGRRGASASGGGSTAATASAAAEHRAVGGRFTTGAERLAHVNRRHAKARQPRHHHDAARAADPRAAALRKRGAGTTTRVQASLGGGDAERDLRRAVGAQPTVVVGLHTCGPLADATLHLAVRHGAAAVLDVPCCFRLLERRAGLLLPSAPDPDAAGIVTPSAYRARSDAGRRVAIDALATATALTCANGNHALPREAFEEWVVRRAHHFTLLELLRLEPERFPVQYRQQPSSSCGTNSGSGRSSASARLTVPKELSPRYLAMTHDDAACAPVDLHDRGFGDYVTFWERATVRRDTGVVAAPGSLVERRSSDELDAFAARPDVTERVRQLVVRSAMRDVLGWHVEAALLLDRAFGLADAGYDVMARRVLDERLSARSLGIVGVRRRVTALPV